MNIIQDVMKKHEISMKEIARRTNIPYSTLANYKNKEQVSEGVTKSLIKYFMVREKTPTRTDEPKLLRDNTPELSRGEKQSVLTSIKDDIKALMTATAQLNNRLDTVESVLWEKQ